MTTDAVVLDERAVAQLADRFTGTLVGPGSAEYDEARKVWNGSIDRRPALVARCVDNADVASAIAVAREHDLPLAVRGGGHSFPGYSTVDGGVIADLSGLKQIAIDPDRGTVRVGGGVLLGELDAATQDLGLAVPAGIVTHTGVAGLTLGGGLGWLQRKLGLTVDQLLAVELVTASGDVVRADLNENAELFWGVRGAGSNFGIVTSFEFRLNPIGPTVLAGPIFWPMEDSPRLLRFYREWIAEAPDELMTIVLHRKAPALPFVPTELHGKLVVAVICCYSGPIDDGERVIAPLRNWGSSVLDLCAPKPYTTHQAMFDPGFKHGWWYYMRSCDVAELDDDVIDTTFDYAMRIESPTTAFPIWQMGGALSRVPSDETPFNGRNAGYTFNITASTTTSEGFEHERDWVRSFWTALEPHHTSVYVNFLMDEGEDRIRDAYGHATYDRLKALKRAYDPENVFRLNQNISPT